MRTNARGVALIKEFEGCSFVAYQGGLDGIWTIGWGHTGGVHDGDQCSPTQAQMWLEQDLGNAERILSESLGEVFRELTDNQVSALASFVMNVGPGKKDVKAGFRELTNGEPSTLLRCLLARDLKAAAEEFPKWCKVNGVPADGILRRRLAEKALFSADIA